MAQAILIVEDSRREAEALEVLLRSVGIYNPISIVSNGSEAIAYLQGEGKFANREEYPPLAVLLLDLRMPDMDGFDVMEWLKGQGHLQQMLVVVLSAYDGIREVNHAYSLGARSFLVKPCNRSDIENLMRSFPEYWLRAPAPLEPSAQPNPETRL